MVKTNSIPVYSIKKGDRILIFNTQLERKFAQYGQWKVFSAIVLSVNRRVKGVDDQYQLEFSDNRSGWYDSGYTFCLPDDRLSYTQLESQKL